MGASKAPTIPRGFELAEKNPPPDPLPATERGRRGDVVWLAPPLRCGEGVGGRGFLRQLCASIPLREKRPDSDSWWRIEPVVQVLPIRRIVRPGMPGGLVASGSACHLLS